jgi:hypothetical protein
MAARLLGCSFATTEEWDADACSTLHSAFHCTAKACRPNRQTCAKCNDVPHSTCDDLQKLRFVIDTDTDTGEENFSGSWPMGSARKVVCGMTRGRKTRGVEAHQHTR